MKLLDTYADKGEAEAAAAQAARRKRLACERDATEVIHNLFGMLTWGNFHRLGMYDLHELQALLVRRDAWSEQDVARHQKILATLQIVAKNHMLAIPAHWQ